MKFEFSLEPVLKVRKHEEKIEKQKLAKKINKKNNLDQIRTRLKEKLEEHLDKEGRKKFINLHDLRRHQQHINDLYEKVHKVNNSLRVIKEAVDQQRDKLADVHKKRHIMEKVKEEERELFLKEISKQERKVMDEIATQTFSK